MKLITEKINFLNTRFMNYLSAKNVVFSNIFELPKQMNQPIN
tara:strand:+ start:21318 stop:21443 length:126 start_codon:yes stop_codon:yes gene_type:complete